MKAVNLVLRQFYSDMTITQMIDLKIGKLTHGDVGQMDSYIRMFDDLYIIYLSGGRDFVLCRRILMRRVLILLQKSFRAALLNKKT